MIDKDFFYGLLFGRALSAPSRFGDDVRATVQRVEDALHVTKLSRDDGMRVAVAEYAGLLARVAAVYRCASDSVAVVTARAEGGTLFVEFDAEAFEMAALLWREEPELNAMFYGPEPCMCQRVSGVRHAHGDPS